MKKYILLRSLVALLFEQDLWASNNQPLQMVHDNFMTVITKNKAENYVIKQSIPFCIDSLNGNGYDTLKEIITDFYLSGEYQVPIFSKMQPTRCAENKIISPVNLLLYPVLVPIRNFGDLVEYSLFTTLYLFCQPQTREVKSKFHFCVNGFVLPSLQHPIFDGTYLPTNILESSIVTLNSVAQNQNIFKIDKIEGYFKHFYQGVWNFLKNGQFCIGKNVVLLPMSNIYSIENNYFYLLYENNYKLTNIFETKLHELKNEIKQQFSVSLINQKENQKYLDGLKNSVIFRCNRVASLLEKEKKKLNEQAKEVQNINIDNVISILEGSKQYILSFYERLQNDKLSQDEGQKLRELSKLNEEDSYEELTESFKPFYDSLKGVKDTLKSCYNSVELELSSNEAGYEYDDFGLEFIQTIDMILQCINTKDVEQYVQITQEYIEEKKKANNIAEDITLIDEKISLLNLRKESIKQQELNKNSLQNFLEELTTIKNVLSQETENMEELIKQMKNDIAGFQEHLDSIHLIDKNVNNITDNITNVLNSELLNNIVQAIKEIGAGYQGHRTYKTIKEALIAITNYLSTFNAIITYMKSLITINQEKTPNLYNLEQILEQIISNTKSLSLWRFSRVDTNATLIDSMPKDQIMNGSRQSKTDQLYQLLEILNGKVLEDIKGDDDTSRAIQTGVTIQINKIYGFIKLYNHFVSSIKSGFKKESQTSSEELINQIVNQAIMSTVRTVVSSVQTSAQQIQQDAEIKNNFSKLFSAVRTNFLFKKNIDKYFSPIMKAKEDLGKLGAIPAISKYANDIRTIRRLINDITNELTSQLEKHLDQFNIKSEQEIENENEQETAQLDDECGEVLELAYECD